MGRNEKVGSDMDGVEWKRVEWEVWRRLGWKEGWKEGRGTN